MLLCKVIIVRANEGPSSTQQLKTYTAECIHIGPMRCPSAIKLLGCRIRRTKSVLQGPGRSSSVRLSRNAEISNLPASIVFQDVLRLEVSVDPISYLNQA